MRGPDPRAARDLAAGTGAGASSEASAVAREQVLRERGLRVDGPSTPHLVEPWPQGISRTPNMRISDVLGTLRAEFPAITHSKLRFLEEQGLVEPRRTASGYRQYSLADVERLRFVLAEQRDRYLPLKVIKDKLAALDQGDTDTSGPAPRPVPAASQALHAADRVTAATLAQEAGVDPQLVADLVAAGVIRPNARGHFDAWTQEIVTCVAALAEHGLEARHLRAVRTAVDREISLVDQVVAPLRSQTAPSARARAGALGAELGETFARLHTAMLRQAVGDL